jgi:hypothetical protein
MTTMTKAKSYRVFYQDSRMFREQACDFSSEGPIALPRSTFEKHYHEVGIFEAPNGRPDDIFALLNDAAGIPNPLGDPSSQQKIRELDLHTSMSKGDILQDVATGKMLYCASFGWSDFEVV